MKTNIGKKKKQTPPPDLNDLNDNHIVENKEDASVGEKLCNLRKIKGLSFKDISSILRVSEYYLHAIETMDRNALPERVYALGFVRSYAQHLGLEPQEVVNQFKKEIYLNDAAERLSLPEPVTEMSRASWKIILICTAIVGVVIISWYQLTQKKRVPEPTHSAMVAQDIAKEELAPLDETPSMFPQVQDPADTMQKSLIEHSLKPQSQSSNVPMSVISKEPTP